MSSPGLRRHAVTCDAISRSKGQKVDWKYIHGIQRNSLCSWIFTIYELTKRVTRRAPRLVGPLPRHQRIGVISKWQGVLHIVSAIGSSILSLLRLKAINAAGWLEERKLLTKTDVCAAGFRPTTHALWAEVDDAICACVYACTPLYTRYDGWQHLWRESGWRNFKELE